MSSPEASPAAAVGNRAGAVRHGVRSRRCRPPRVSPADQKAGGILSMASARFTVGRRTARTPWTASSGVRACEGFGPEVPDRTTVKATWEKCRTADRRGPEGPVRWSQRTAAGRPGQPRAALGAGTAEACPRIPHGLSGRHSGQGAAPWPSEPTNGAAVRAALGYATGHTGRGQAPKNQGVGDARSGGSPPARRAPTPTPLPTPPGERADPAGPTGEPGRPACADSSSSRGNAEPEGVSRARSDRESGFDEGPTRCSARTRGC